MNAGLIRKIPEARFDDLEVDGNDVLEDSLPEGGHTIDFRLRLPRSSSSSFHDDLDSLLRIEPSISRGKLPSDYYLIKENYYSFDEDQPAQIDALKRVCRLIVGLGTLAHYHDEKPSSGYLRLIFIQPQNDKETRPIEIETRVTLPVVEAATELEPRLLEELSESSASNDPHYSAKVGVFGTSLADFIGSRSVGHAFEYLVAHWDEFIISYQRDLTTYLSGFAFHKAKQEVAEAELKIAGEFSKVLSDITGKLLSIPISVAAVIAIPKANTIVERLLLLTGVFVASFIISRTVDHQRRQFQRIQNSKQLVLSSIEGKKESYPAELAKAVDDMIGALERDERGLSNSLKLFGVLSWLPLGVSLGVFGYLYWGVIKELAIASFVFVVALFAGF